MIETILRDVKLEEVEDGILSSLKPEERQSDYDTKVKAYDLVVGNALYNRLLWGNWPSNYTDFCRRALNSTPGGVYLDAGCGSLVFTAEAYAEASNNLIVLFDRSIGMLRKGRERLKKLHDGDPRNIFFVQGDIFDLPFKDAAFDTVASFGVIHMFEEKMNLLTELDRVKDTGGRLFFSSLVGNNPLGKKYLEMLKRAGEVAACHTTQSLSGLLSHSPFNYKVTSIGNMAYGESEISPL